MGLDSGCELHDAAIGARAGEADEFLQWAHTPIGDECQRCAVCRWARTYIDRRLAERAGVPPRSEDSSEVAWKHLQAALAEVRSTIHRSR